MNEAFMSKDIFIINATSEQQQKWQYGDGSCLERKTIVSIPHNMVKAHNRNDSRKKVSADLFVKIAFLLTLRIACSDTKFFLEARKVYSSLWIFEGRSYFCRSFLNRMLKNGCTIRQLSNERKQNLDLTFLWHWPRKIVSLKNGWFFCAAHYLILKFWEAFIFKWS